MSIVLDGTTGITTPGLTNTGSETVVNLTTTGNTILGDASTDTLNVGNGGLIKDASGNVGVGVTPTGWSGLTAIQVGQAASLFAQSGADYIGGYVGSNIYYNAGWKYIRNGYATKYDFNESNNGQHRWWIAPNNTSGAGAAATETQAMTLDASGRLILGDTTADGRLKVVETAAGAGVTFYNSANNSAGQIGTTNEAGAANSLEINAYRGSGRIVFKTNNTYAASIDSSGNWLVGTTSQLGTGFLCLKYAGGATSNGLVTQPSVNQYYNPAVFRNFSGTDTGYIQVNAGGNTTIFGTSSDYRLKNTIVPMTGALAKVMQLNPCTYTWKSDGSDGQGFIAHELQAIIPDAVIGEKDAVDTEGNPKYQGVDTSFLVATLTAAIQEQQALITTLTARITALEAK
jgi:hypothetical protein